jgi:hypothetical protein
VSRPSGCRVQLSMHPAAVLRVSDARQLVDQCRTDTFNANTGDQEVHEEYDPAQSQRGFQAHPVKVCALATSLPRQLKPCINGRWASDCIHDGLCNGMRLSASRSGACECRMVLYRRL